MSRARIVLLSLCLLPIACGESPPAPPPTDIFIAELSVADGVFTVGEPVAATDRDGYDNQPAFLPGGEALLYSSIGDDGQAEIHRYDLREGRSERLTRTPEDEYSPTLLPGRDGFSVVRVEPDGKQRLWRFDASGGDPALLLERPDQVGYFAWIDPSTVALFVLGDDDAPPTLQIALIGSGEAKTMAESVGRCLQRVPGRRAISFVHKESDEAWWVKQLDVDSGRIEPLVQTLPDCEDYAWTPEGTLLMPCGTKLHAWRRGSDDSWREIADLRGFGLFGLTRAALSPSGDRVALVADRRRGPR